MVVLQVGDTNTYSQHMPPTNNTSTEEKTLRAPTAHNTLFKPIEPPPAACPVPRWPDLFSYSREVDRGRYQGVPRGSPEAPPKVEHLGPHEVRDAENRLQHGANHEPCFRVRVGPSVTPGGTAMQAN